MKGARFDRLHRAALRWPLYAWDYVGIDVDDEVHRAEAERGEVSVHLPPLTPQMLILRIRAASKRVLALRERSVWLSRLAP